MCSSDLGAEYEITVKRTGNMRVIVDGKEIAGNVVPAFGSGKHTVTAEI